jgi:hypothetical protein
MIILFFLLLLICNWPVFLASFVVAVLATNKVLGISTAFAIGFFSLLVAAGTTIAFAFYGPKVQFFERGICAIAWNQ